MHVYNTATVGDVTPGEYYNNGTKWDRMVGASDLNVTVVNQTGDMPYGSYSSSSYANTGVSFNFLRAGTYIIKLQQSYGYISGCQDLVFTFSGATIVTQSVEEKKQLCGNINAEWWTPIYYISVNGPGVVNLKYRVSTGTAVNLSIPGNTGNRAISIN
ncbi:hypothetical protein [Pseudarcicella hirudinis]|nr:hypothetical protein [Pseudarcicella hirudinis]